MRASIATEAADRADAVDIGFAAYGVAAAVSVSPPYLAARVRSLLPPGWSPATPPADAMRFEVSVRDGAFVVRVDDVARTTSADLDRALGVLDAEVRAHVAFRAPARIFVHAGVVGHGDGAILVPGPSFTGKTTLVAALVRAGAIYYSDEYAVLDQRGFVHPYPRPLSLRHEGGDHSAESLGGTVGTDPLPVAVVALTTFRPGARWEPDPGSAGDGAMGLLANTVPARDRPREALAAVSRAAATAQVLLGERGEAAEAAADLLSR